MLYVGAFLHWPNFYFQVSSKPSSGYLVRILPPAGLLPVLVVSCPRHVQELPNLPHLQYSTVQFTTVQYSTVQYSTVQFTTVQYSTLKTEEAPGSTAAHSQPLGPVLEHLSTPAGECGSISGLTLG